MTIERVNYFDRQFLRVEDFKDEQDYHVSMRRRHNISHHTWGIVAGLEPTIVDGSLYVSPGLAVDGFGRELILETQQPLPAKAFIDFDTDQLQVWMDYATTVSSPPPKGYADCSANAAQQYYRLAEQPTVRLAKPDVNSTPRMPSSVLPTDRNFDATQAAPEDRNWPIYLGSLTYKPNNTDQPYTIDLSGRPYAGLIGEGVTAASESTQVQIGAENPDDVNRFAVFVPASATAPCLAVQKDGTVTVQGESKMQGNLTVSGGYIEVGVGPAVSPQPWRIYRIQDVDATGTANNELRIEMGGGGAGNNKVVIGAWSATDSKFSPCLTIADDGTVTVSGNLVIMGKLDVNPDNRVPGTLTAEAKAYVASAALSGIIQGHVQVNQAKLAQAQGAPPATPPPPPPGMQLREAVTLISHPDEQHLRVFASMLKSDFKDVAEKLRKFL